MINNMGENLRIELNTLLKSEKLEDEIWMVYCDQLCDFKGYLPKDNPENLEFKFSYRVILAMKKLVEEREEREKLCYRHLPFARGTFIGQGFMR